MMKDEILAFIDKMVDEYKNCDICMGELLAYTCNLPADMSIEDAVYIYAVLMEKIEGDEVIRQNTSDGWSERIADWYD